MIGPLWFVPRRSVTEPFGSTSSSLSSLASRFPCSLLEGSNLSTDSLLVHRGIFTTTAWYMIFFWSWNRILCMYGTRIWDCGRHFESPGKLRMGKVNSPWTTSRFPSVAGKKLWAELKLLLCWFPFPPAPLLTVRYDLEESQPNYSFIKETLEKSLIHDGMLNAASPHFLML